MYASYIILMLHTAVTAVAYVLLLLNVSPARLIGVTAALVVVKVAIL